MKVSKENISFYTRCIRQHFEDMGYTVAEKLVGQINSVIQQNIQKSAVKFVFEYHTTGRITIKSHKNDEILTNDFINRHEEALGTKFTLLTNENINNNFTSPSNTSKNANSSDRQPLLRSPNIPNVNTPPSTNRKTAGINTKRNTPRKITDLQGTEIIVQNYEQEVISLKREINELRETINNLQQHSNTSPTINAEQLDETIRTICEQSINKRLQEHLQQQNTTSLLRQQNNKTNE